MFESKIESCIEFIVPGIDSREDTETLKEILSEIKELQEKLDNYFKSFSISRHQKTQIRSVLSLANQISRFEEQPQTQESSSKRRTNQCFMMQFNGNIW